MDSKLEKSLLREIKGHAKAVGIPEGSAIVFAKTTVESVKKMMPKNATITEQDLERAVIRELKKYNKDLAYIYKNYRRII